MLYYSKLITLTLVSVSDPILKAQLETLLKECSPLENHTVVALGKSALSPQRNSSSVLVHAKHETEVLAGLSDHVKAFSSLLVVPLLEPLIGELRKRVIDEFDKEHGLFEKQIQLVAEGRYLRANNTTKVRERNDSKGRDLNGLVADHTRYTQLITALKDDWSFVSETLSEIELAMSKLRKCKNPEMRKIWAEAIQSMQSLIWIKMYRNPVGYW